MDNNAKLQSLGVLLYFCEPRCCQQPKPDNVRSLFLRQSFFLQTGVTIVCSKNNNLEDHLPPPHAHNLHIYKSRALFKSALLNFSYFSTKTYVVGTHKNRLNETVLLST